MDIISEFWKDTENTLNTSISKWKKAISEFGETHCKKKNAVSARGQVIKQKRTRELKGRSSIEICSCFNTPRLFRSHLQPWELRELRCQSDNAQTGQRLLLDPISMADEEDENMVKYFFPL